MAVKTTILIRMYTLPLRLTNWTATEFPKTSNIPLPSKLALTSYPIKFTSSKLETRKPPFLALLFPLLGPNSWADTKCHLLHILASLFISSVFQTKKPLVVPVPAMVGLVISGEPSVTRGGAHIFDHLHGLLLVFGEFGDFSEHGLVKLWHDECMY